jgi:hypothetical protein
MDIQAQRDKADAFWRMHNRSYLLGIGQKESRFEHAVSRLKAYRAAGADCLYPMGYFDPRTIAARSMRWLDRLTLWVCLGCLRRRNWSGWALRVSALPRVLRASP